jgi:hypothetical protein
MSYSTRQEPYKNPQPPKTVTRAKNRSSERTTMAFPSYPPRATSHNQCIQELTPCLSKDPKPGQELSRAIRSLSLEHKGSNRQRATASSWFSNLIHRSKLANLSHLDIPAATIATLILISFSQPGTSPRAISAIISEAKH